MSLSKYSPFLGSLLQAPAHYLVATPELSQCLHCYRIISKSEEMGPVSQSAGSLAIYGKNGPGSTAGGSLLVFFGFNDCIGSWQLESSIPCLVQLEPKAL